MNRKGEELKHGWFGVYKGNEYVLTGDMKGNRIIRTKDKNIVDDTFSYNHNSGFYRKIIDSSEIEYAYELKIHVIVDGKEIGALKETEDEYLVTTNGNDKDIIEKYKLKEIDRYVFEGWIPKKDVELIERKRELQYDPKTKDIEYKD